MGTTVHKLPIVRTQYDNNNNNNNNNNNHDIILIMRDYGLREMYARVESVRDYTYLGVFFTGLGGGAVVVKWWEGNVAVERGGRECRSAVADKNENIVFSMFSYYYYDYYCTGSAALHRQTHTCAPATESVTRRAKYVSFVIAATTDNVYDHTSRYDL